MEPFAEHTKAEHAQRGEHYAAEEDQPQIESIAQHAAYKHTLCKITESKFCCGDYSMKKSNYHRIGGQEYGVQFAEKHFGARMIPKQIMLVPQVVGLEHQTTCLIIFYIARAKPFICTHKIK